MIVTNPNLSADELRLLKDGVAFITILIAGADGLIEDEELQRAEKIAKIRSYNLPPLLSDFYKAVGIDFHDRLVGLIAELPRDVKTRTEVLTERLKSLNPVMAKLDQREGAELYRSYVSFADHVAKASGGFLGFFSVGFDESHFVGLPMLTPIYISED
jgi:hypothetical protein